MGRKKIDMVDIQDNRVRRVTFKKRRIGLLKKAIQLSKLTNAHIVLQVFNSEDNSYMLYESESHPKKTRIREADEWVKFSDANHDLVEFIEDMVTKHGNLNSLKESNDKFYSELMELDGFNKLALFSHTKRPIVSVEEPMSSKRRVDHMIERAKSMCVEQLC
jgi:hypothetical protein